MARLKDKGSIAQSEKYLRYGMVLYLVTLMTSKRVARVCQHQLSFLLPFAIGVDRWSDVNKFLID